MFRSTADGTSDATAVYGVDDVLEASFRDNNVDTPLTKIARSAYQALSNKHLQDSLHNYLYKDL